MHHLTMVTSSHHFKCPPLIASSLLYLRPPIQNFFKFSFSNNLISLFFNPSQSSHISSHTITFNLNPVSCLPRITVFFLTFLLIGVLWAFFNYYFHLVSYISSCLISYPLIHYTVLGWFLNSITSHRLIFALFSSFDPNTNTYNSHLISYISSCLICCHINTLCCFPIYTI